MSIVRTALQIVLRAVVLALGLFAYDRGYDQVVAPTSGDADIGKGLLAFLLLVVVSMVWAFVDGLRHPPLVWLVVWAVTGLAVGAGWELVARVVDNTHENAALGLDLFFAQLVIWPACLGAGFAWLVAGRRNVGPVSTTR